MANLSGERVPRPLGRTLRKRARNCLNTRHCERSEAIQNLSTDAVWIASSQGLLAMTGVEAAVHKHLAA
jgi:hypothetical protein